MDVDSLLSQFPIDSPLLTLVFSLVALALSVVVLLRTATIRRVHQSQYALLREKADTLWRELDDIRSGAVDPPGTTSPREMTEGTVEARYLAEKEVYAQLWPQIWQLHDRLGVFLRAVEAGEPPGEMRLEARNAALDARKLLNRNRPFCCEEVDNLISRIIDTEIRIHLAACRFLDLLKDEAAHPSHDDRRELQEKYHTLYEGEARELINQLAQTIRHRVIQAT